MNKVVRVHPKHIFVYNFLFIIRVCNLLVAYGVNEYSTNDKRRFLPKIFIMDVSLAAFFSMKCVGWRKTLSDHEKTYGEEACQRAN